MLWPIILPFQITVCFVAVLVGAATAVASIVRCRRLPTFLVASSLGILAFVPSCNAIMRVLDRQRFGVFEYASFSEINDHRVERYLPSSAEAIIVDRRAQGFRAVRDRRRGTHVIHGPALGYVREPLGCEPEGDGQRDGSCPGGNQ